MRRRSGFLTFLSALIPGVGYMYLGIVKKGFEALLLFFLIKPIFKTLGLGSLGSIITIPLWFYFFFDTFRIANKMDRGEFVPDSCIIIDKILGNSHKQNNNYNNQFNNSNMGNNMNNQYDGMNNNQYNNMNNNVNYDKTDPVLEKKKWMIIAWSIIILGVLGVISKALEHTVIFTQLRLGISKYFVPLLFILGGLFLLKKRN